MTQVFGKTRVNRKKKKERMHIHLAFSYFLLAIELSPLVKNTTRPMRLLGEKGPTMKIVSSQLYLIMCGSSFTFMNIIVVSMQTR